MVECEQLRSKATVVLGFGDERRELRKLRPAISQIDCGAIPVYFFFFFFSLTGKYRCEVFVGECRSTTSRQVSQADVLGFCVTGGRAYNWAGIPFPGESVNHWDAFRGIGLSYFS
jgi:hypothetical protein